MSRVFETPKIPWKIESTISIGNILTLIVMLASLWGFSIRLESRLVSLETKVELILGNKIQLVLSTGNK